MGPRPVVLFCRRCGAEELLPGRVAAREFASSTEWASNPRLFLGDRWESCCPACRREAARNRRDRHHAGALLVEIALEHVPWYGDGLSVAELHQRVLDDFGSINRRSVYAALNRLAVDGEIERVGLWGGYRYRRKREARRTA